MHDTETPLTLRSASGTNISLRSVGSIAKQIQEDTEETEKVTDALQQRLKFYKNRDMPTPVRQNIMILDELKEDSDFQNMEPQSHCEEREILLKLDLNERDSNNLSIIEEKDEISIDSLLLKARNYLDNNNTRNNANSSFCSYIGSGRGGYQRSYEL